MGSLQFLYQKLLENWFKNKLYIHSFDLQNKLRYEKHFNHSYILLSY